MSPGGEGSARGPSSDVWAALGLQHPPLSSLKWGAQSAVGGRPSVSLLNFLWWAPHPPWPTLLAAPSLQASAFQLPGHQLHPAWPRRELQQRASVSLLSTLTPVLLGHCLPSDPSTGALPVSPPHYTQLRAAGEQQVPHEGGHCLCPCGLLSHREGALLRYKALVRGTAAFRLAAAEPRSSQAHCEDVPK